MNIKPYPTLDGRAKLTDIGSIADAIFGDYHQTQNNQSDYLPVHSFSEDVSKNQSPAEIAAAVENSLHSLLTLYIPDSRVRTNVIKSPVTGHYTINITMQVKDGKNIRDIGRQIKANGSQILQLSTLYNTGEVVEYPIEKRDYNTIWEQ